MGVHEFNRSFGSAVWRAVKPSPAAGIRVSASALIPGAGLSISESAQPLAARLDPRGGHELSYGLHIVLRYELELALLEQGLPMAELPERWNQRFAGYSVNAPTR